MILMFLLTICSGRQLADKWVLRILGEGKDDTDSEGLKLYYILHRYFKITKTLLHCLFV